MTTSWRSVLSALVLALLLVGMVATAAMAQEPAAQTDSLLITEGPLTVGAEDDLGTVVVVTGDVEVTGSVDNVIAFEGDVIVTGDVDGLAWAVTGNLTVAEGATVGGDAMAGGTLDVAPGTVEGTARRMTGTDWATSAIVFGILWWIGAAIATFVLGVLLLWLAPRGMAAARQMGRSRIGASFGIGLALLVGVPVVAGLIAFTLVGLPLTFALLVATGIAAFVGGIVSALVVGNVLLRGANPVVELLTGLVVIGLLGLLPFVGGLVTAAAAVFGVGALALAVWRARTTPTVITIPEARRAEAVTPTDQRTAPPAAPPPA